MSRLGRVVGSRPFGRPDRRPALSFVVPVFDPPVEILARTLASIDAQTSSDWECVVVDDRSRTAAVVELLDAWEAGDERHRLIRRSVNGGIAAATNDAIDAAVGRILAFVDHDDLVDPQAAVDVIDHLDRHPDHDLVYTDERVVDENGAVRADFRKPDYSPVRHLGQHYLAHMVAVRASAIGEVRVRAEFEPAQDVDFVLRLVEGAMRRGRGVGHIASQRYSWRAIAGSSAHAAAEKPGMCEAVHRSIDAALERRGIAAETSIVVHDGEPTTSIRITPTGPGPTATVVAVGPGTDTIRLADALASSVDDVVVLDPPGAPPGWWESMVRVLGLPGVAAAAPHLVDGGGTIVSVGRVVDPLVRDVLAGTPDGPGPWGAFFVHREVSAVAPWGAVFDRRALVEAGGFDSAFGLDVAIVDACARLRDRGRTVVCSPAARLVIDPTIAAPTRARDDDWARLLAGRPDLDRSERYDLTGIAPQGSSWPSAWDQAHAAIAAGAVDLVTTDVFDTLVSRPASRPSDLFVAVGRRLAEHEAPELDPIAFAHARRHAEAACRRRVHRLDRAAGDERSPEVTIEEIWDALGPSVGVDPTVGLDTELGVEIESLRPVPEMIDVLDSARRAGCRTVAVSDNYLSGAQLTRVLEGCGFPIALLDGIVTSSDHRRSKADGLLALVIDRADTPAERVLHVGDNDVSDVATAEQLGAVAAHVEVRADARHVVRPRPALAAVSARTATDGGIDAASRAVLVAAGSLGCDPSFQFGVAGAGPAIVSFARWAATTAEALEVSSLHCLLREGAEIARLVDLVAPDRVATPLVHASRWVTMRAACIEATPDELFTALARRGPTTAAHVERAFGCDAAAVAAVWGAETVMPHELDPACVRLAADDRLRSQIVESAARLRTRVVRLLERELSDDDRLVVCDVGWGGTIQEGLERILRSIGDQRPVTGLYFALSHPGEERLAAGADMRSYLPHAGLDAVASEASRVVSHHADSIERVLTPEIGTFVDVDVDGGPVVADRVEYQSPSLLTARAGIERLAERLATTGMDDDVVDDHTVRSALASDLADVIQRPSPTVASALLGWQHDDVAGDDVRSLAGGADPALVAAMTPANADLLGGEIGTWVAGLAAAHNPALAIQLDAGGRAERRADLVATDGLGGALVAAFPIDSQLAELQIMHDPGLGANGQLAIRLRGAVSSLRALRFDASERAVLVQLERFELELVDEHGSTTTIDLADDVRGPGVRVAGPRRYGQRPGGFVAYHPPTPVAGSVRHVDALVVFRRWSIDPDDPALRPGLRDLARRIRR